MSDPTVAAAIDRALAAIADLEALGQEIEDEWSYVGDLADAWRDRLGEVAAARGDADLDGAADAAVDAAIAEAALITDPHRAIDWLSTFPQVVLLALGAPETGDVSA